MAIDLEARREEGIKRMGVYMLSGWTMLNECCSQPCGMPLFRSKDKSVTLCCLCDHPTDPMPAVATNDSQNNKDNDSQNDKEGAELDNEELDLFRQSMQVPKSDSDRASELLGPLMLQGWVLIQEECSKCHGIPLLRKNKQLLCVLCDEATRNTIPNTESQLQGLNSSIGQCLKSKLDFLSRRLDSEDDIGSIGRICDAIASCSNALKAVSSL